jgi:hypothetical protein
MQTFVTNNEKEDPIRDSVDQRSRFSNHGKDGKDGIDLGCGHFRSPEKMEKIEPDS